MDMHTFLVIQNKTVVLDHNYIHLELKHKHVQFSTVKSVSKKTPATNVLKVDGLTTTHKLEFKHVFSVNNLTASNAMTIMEHVTIVIKIMPFHSLQENVNSQQ